MFSFLISLQTISRFSISSPPADSRRNGVAIVAIVKNEEAYIAEWAGFHLRTGVRMFYIYDNGSTDTTVATLRQSLPAENLLVIPWNQQIHGTTSGLILHNQVLAYAHAVANFGSDYRWMAFIDVDEFLVPKQASSLPEALTSLENHDNISLPWHMYGTSGHKTKPRGGVLENYVQRHRDPMSTLKGMCNFKCIVDPCRLTSLRVHSMSTNNQWITANDIGKVTEIKHRHNREFYSSENIQLNHYYTRSEEEFLKKREKGHVNIARSRHYYQKLQDMMNHIDHDTIEDRCALDFISRIE